MVKISHQYEVKAIERIQEKQGIIVDENSLTANGKKVPISCKMNLVDQKASDSVKKLYAYLEAVGKTECVLYGHQNDTWNKVGNQKLSNSDTKDVTGSIAAVIGIDALALVGNECPGNQGKEKIASNQERIKACAKHTKEVMKEGAIITLSAHMPNYRVMAQRSENQKNSQGFLDWKKAKFLSEGNETDGSWVTEKGMVTKVMPEGELNYIFTAYLDMIAAYLEEVGEEVPILFRPLHENTGSWFWWGAEFCTEEEYKKLYQYIVKYLRDQKNIHNLLYVYSPGSENQTVSEFEERYPGDDYVDMVGFDMYHPMPKIGDHFIEDFKKQLNIVGEFAKLHQKLFAVTETGVSNGDVVLLQTGNERKDWYNEILEVVSQTKASYFLLWANFGKEHHYTPYVTEENNGVLIGHEMLDGFIKFYNNPKSIFAKEQGDFSKLEIKNCQSSLLY